MPRGTAVLAPEDTAGPRSREDRPTFDEVFAMLVRRDQATREQAVATAESGPDADTLEDVA